MLKEDIGNLLKEKRKELNLSVKSVVEKLSQLEVVVSEKTIYGSCIIVLYAHVANCRPIRIRGSSQSKIYAVHPVYIQVHNNS